MNGHIQEVKRKWNRVNKRTEPREVQTYTGRDSEGQVQKINK